ncbi:MAG TPA: PilW family protein, partial [Gallionella sp.]|nr:PilW family protein [Gallionella sp.]
MKKDGALLRMNIPRQRGLSLVELMVSLTIGLILLAGLSLLFVESSRSHRELSEASKQIENGRYALQLLTDDLHVAGFYGHFANLSTIPTPVAAPDPCEVGSTSAMYDALPIYIQGYAAASFTAKPAVSTLCGAASLLTAANLQPGSDVFAIRRADTNALAVGATAVNQETYIQASGSAEIQRGAGNAITNTSKADGVTNTDIFLRGVAAPIRKYRVHVYFVAPCSMPANGGSVCTGANDDGGRPIPTLKRLELTVAGGTPKMSIVSLVEGIEMLKIDYGIDLLPNPNVNNTVGDGAPEIPFVRVPATPANWADVMGADLYILSRNPQLTTGHIDAKTYAMGLAGNYAPGGNFKRHLYSA